MRVELERCDMGYLLVFRGGRFMGPCRDADAPEGRPFYRWIDGGTHVLEIELDPNAVRVLRAELEAAARR